MGDEQTNEIRTVLGTNQSIEAGEAQRKMMLSLQQKRFIGGGGWGTLTFAK